MSDFRETTGLYKREVWEVNGGAAAKWAVFYYVVGLAWYKLDEGEGAMEWKTALRESEESYKHVIENKITDKDIWDDDTATMGT